MKEYKKALNDTSKSPQKNKLKNKKKKVSSKIESLFLEKDMSLVSKSDMTKELILERKQKNSKVSRSSKDKNLLNEFFKNDLSKNHYKTEASQKPTLTINDSEISSKVKIILECCLYEKISKKII